jgi:hypothetical protein
MDPRSVSTKSYKDRLATNYGASNFAYASGDFCARCRISVNNHPISLELFYILRIHTCRFNLSHFRRRLGENWAQANAFCTSRTFCTPKLIIVPHPLFPHLRVHSYNPGPRVIFYPCAYTTATAFFSLHVWSCSLSATTKPQHRNETPLRIAFSS